MKILNSRIILNLLFVLMGISLMVMNKWYFVLIIASLTSYIGIVDGKRWKRGDLN